MTLLLVDDVILFGQVDGSMMKATFKEFSKIIGMEVNL